METNTSPITYDRLTIENFPTMKMEKILITNSVNEHAKLQVTGIIEDDGSSLLTNTMVCSPIKTVYQDNDGEKKTLFAGMITNVKVYKKESHQIVEIIALGNTGNLDTKRESRSCQDINTTYRALMDEVATANGACITYGMKEKEYVSPIGEISIRYKETAWEYLKRLASHKNQGLFGDMTAEKPVFSVSAAGNAFEHLEMQAYEYHKDIRNYEMDQANYLQDILEEDYLIYQVETYQILNIGTKVNFQGKTLYIREASYEMKNATILATYQLRTENGLKQRRLKNEKLQGLSINGTAEEVERDKVKIQLDIDREKNAKYLFPYSTMSASPDGSGWYCMPKKGDLLRVYFPDDEEANCFAISSVSSYTPEEGNTTDMMSDPSVRYLRTPDNKEIKLTPDGITISADDGQALIIMDNAGNVTISGAAGINITATNDVNISASRNVSLYAADTIRLSGQAGSIEMDSSGNTRIFGQYVMEN